MTKLKLFVCKGLCPNYTDELVFAIAKTEDDAKKALIEACGDHLHEWVIWKSEIFHRVRIV